MHLSRQHVFRWVRLVHVGMCARACGREHLCASARGALLPCKARLRAICMPSSMYVHVYVHVCACPCMQSMYVHVCPCPTPCMQSMCVHVMRCVLGPCDAAGSWRSWLLSASITRTISSTRSTGSSSPVSSGAVCVCPANVPLTLRMTPSLRVALSLPLQLPGPRRARAHLPEPRGLRRFGLTFTWVTV